MVVVLLLKHKQVGNCYSERTGLEGMNKCFETSIQQCFYSIFLGKCKNPKHKVGEEK